MPRAPPPRLRASRRGRRRGRSAARRAPMRRGRPRAGTGRLPRSGLPRLAWPSRSASDALRAAACAVALPVCEPRRTWKMKTVTTFRIAAAADIHGSEVHRGRLEQAFGALEGGVDLVLLAGDLTTHGEPEQAAVVADACRLVDAPVVAVLGNHDFHAGKEREVAAVLGDAGVTVLQRDWRVLDLDHTEIGIVGTK